MENTITSILRVIADLQDFCNERTLCAQTPNYQDDRNVEFSEFDLEMVSAARSAPMLAKSDSTRSN